MINKTVLQNGGASAQATEALEKAYHALESAKKRPIHRQPHIVCAGIYNAGKSTLLNALLDTDQFPTGSIPTTTKVAQAEFEGAVYVDTPGLNAMEADDKTAAEAYEAADIYLFVSSAENGGLTKQEAEWLCTLKARHADSALLKDKLVYVLSQCERVEPETLETVCEKARSDLQKVLGICPERVFRIDSHTYRDGKARNEPLLLKEGGVDELRGILREKAKAAAKRLTEDHEKEVDLRRKKLVDQLEALEDSFRQAQQKESGSVDQKINEIQRQWKAFEDALKREMPPETAISPIYCRVSLPSAPSSINNIRERSYSAAKRKFESAFSDIYDKRDRITRKAVDNSIGGVREKYCSTGLNSVYHTYCDKVNHAFEYHIATFQKYGISFPQTDAISATPDLPSNFSEELLMTLLENAVQWSDCYSLSSYVEYGDIDSTQDYERGMFGNMKEVTKYYCSRGYAVVREMEKDINDYLKMNERSANYELERYMKQFRERLKEKVEKRKVSVKKPVDDFCAQLKKGGGNSPAKAALDHVAALKKEIDPEAQTTGGGNSAEDAQKLQELRGDMLNALRTGLKRGG